MYYGSKIYMTGRQAFYSQLRMLQSAREVTVRGMTTRELAFNRFTILHPNDRLMNVPGRNGNPFAQVAETLWVLAGRNDLDWLERYIPQCKKWSDDGKTWRAGYGPRLRQWPIASLSGIPAWYVLDQLGKCVDKLNADPMTRQAVISLWDPGSDWVEGSKDYPCNNWLHFLQRDGALHLNVAVRSNDIWYGFSHVDFYCWSTLLQLMATWTGLDVGTMTWNATSFHIYESQVDKALACLGRQPQHSGSDAVVYPTANVLSDFHNVDGIFDMLFEAEGKAREGDYEPYSGNPSLFGVWDSMLVMYNAWLNHKDDMDSIVGWLAQRVSELPLVGSKLACAEFFSRHIPGFVEYLTVSDQELGTIQHFTQAEPHITS